MHPDARLAALAEPQLGIVTRGQLEHADLTASWIDRRIASGHLRVVHRGVYVLNGEPYGWEQRCLAACLAIGSDSAVSHRAAAKLLGVRLRCDTPVELAVPRPRVPRLKGVVLHRSVDLIPDHTRMLGPIRVTEPHRLLVDLGGVLPWWTVSLALEQCIAARVVTPESVREFLGTVSARGRNGCGVIRQVLDQRALGSAVSDSVLEQRFADLCRSHGIPRPTFQYTLLLGGRWRRIDFAYPELRIAIEVDGYAFHTEHDVFEDDRVRGNELELEGWLVLRFTWKRIANDSFGVVREVRAAIRRRRAEIGA